MYSIKSAIPVIALMFFITPVKLLAQTSSDSLIAQLSRKWTNAKAYALKMAELMPEKYYDFKPVPEEMSFKEQVLHIADNIEWLATFYLFVPRQTGRDTIVKDKAAALEILSYLKYAGSVICWNAEQISFPVERNNGLHYVCCW